jgi:hypothetical protein
MAINLDAIHMLEPDINTLQTTAEAIPSDGYFRLVEPYCLRVGSRLPVGELPEWTYCIVHNYHFSFNRNTTWDPVKTYSGNAVGDYLQTRTETKCMNASVCIHSYIKPHHYILAWSLSGGKLQYIPSHYKRISKITTPLTWVETRFAN